MCVIIVTRFTQCDNCWGETEVAQRCFWSYLLAILTFGLVNTVNWHPLETGGMLLREEDKQCESCEKRSVLLLVDRLLDDIIRTCPNYADDSSNADDEDDETTDSPDASDADNEVSDSSDTDSQVTDSPEVDSKVTGSPDADSEATDSSDDEAGVDTPTSSDTESEDESDSETSSLAPETRHTQCKHKNEIILPFWVRFWFYLISILECYLIDTARGTVRCPLEVAVLVALILNIERFILLPLHKRGYFCFKCTQASTAGSKAEADPEISSPASKEDGPVEGVDYFLPKDTTFHKKIRRGGTYYIDGFHIGWTPAEWVDVPDNYQF